MELHWNWECGCSKHKKQHAKKHDKSRYTVQENETTLNEITAFLLQHSCLNKGTKMTHPFCKTHLHENLGYEIPYLFFGNLFYSPTFSKILLGKFLTQHVYLFFTHIWVLHGVNLRKYTATCLNKFVPLDFINIGTEIKAQMKRRMQAKHQVGVAIHFRSSDPCFSFFDNHNW